MDHATNITDLSLTFPDKAARSAEPPAIIQPSSMTQKANELIERSTTGALPNTISENWGDIVNAGMSVGMYGDLVRMATAPSGWRGPGSLALRPLSLKKFIAFWLAIRDVAKEPELTLAPDGSLHAEWFKSARQHLDVRFADKNVIFGILNQENIVEGAEQPNTVAEFLKLHHAKPLSWSAR
jgi:hypothetical protein